MSKDPQSSHYDHGGIEALDVIKAKLTPEQYKGYLLGNALKYGMRLNFKDQSARDAEKLANYSRWLSGFLNETKSSSSLTFKDVMRVFSGEELESIKDYGPSNLAANQRGVEND